MIGWVLTSAVVAALSIYLVGIYNGLVGLRENMKVCWTDIGLLVRRRHDELPMLVETCGRYLRGEQDTLEKVMRARASLNRALCAGDVASVGTAEQQLRIGMARLLAAANRHAQLNADETFKHLRGHVVALEESIAQRRGLYNAQVDLNNMRVRVFPAVVIAQLLGFEQAPLLEVAAEDPPKIELGALSRA